jgi:nitroreductase
VRRRRADFSSLIHLEVGSWFDCGLLAQTFMLAAKARGLNICPQISLTKYRKVIRRHLPIDDGQIIACGEFWPRRAQSDEGRALALY